ncbi:restriction endonuclease subunit S [Aquirufa beregesia]
MSEVKEFAIGDLVTFQRGHDLPREEMKEGVYPVAGSNSIIGYHNKYTTEGPGITIGRSGNIGNPQLHKTKFWAHNTTLYVKEFKNVDPVFFYYLLQTLDFTQLNSGSAVPSLNRNFIHPFKVKIPTSKHIQNEIAEILSSLDDKIELNNKINQELETLAQTLFKQWFIDFEFPNENGEPYKSSGGEMVDSELGEIPKGWIVATLKDEFVLNMGQSPSGDTYNTDKDGMIFFQGRSDFGFRFPSIRMYTNAPKKVAKRFETLISVRAPVGDINMAADDCCIGRGLGSISHSNKLYTYTYYKILSIQVELKSYDNEGTVFGSINKETLGNIKTIIPPISLSEEFENLFKDLDTKIYNLDLETQNLIKTKDTLLPKLISGELEINEIPS